MRNRGYCGTLTVIQPLLGDERHRGNHSSRLIQLPSLLGNFRELSDLHGSKVNPTHSTQYYTPGRGKIVPRNYTPGIGKIVPRK